MVTGPSVVRGRKNPLHYDIPRRLKAARSAARLSARALSAAAGLSADAVNSIEAGRVPGIDTIEKIAQVLGLSPCLLAYGMDTACPPAAAPRYPGCGGRVQQLREHQQLSKLSLAAAAGLSGSAILPIEAGRTVPSVATAEALAIALDCSPCWLAFGCGADPLQDPRGAAVEAQVLHPRRKLELEQEQD